MQRQKKPTLLLKFALRGSKKLIFSKEQEVNALLLLGPNSLFKGILLVDNTH